MRGPVTRNRFTKPSKEKPCSVDRASSPSRTKCFGLKARNASTISGNAEVRLLPTFDCKKMFSWSRKTRQRNPSHFGSYIHSLPMGKLFTARAFIGDTGRHSNLSFEASDRTGSPLLLLAHKNMPPLYATFNGWNSPSTVISI